jgi:hypothetical protein
MSGGVRMTSSTLDGNKVDMFEVGKEEKPLASFESIAKAGRKFGYYDKNFSNIVYKRVQIEVLWNGKKIKVYFKDI